MFYVRKEKKRKEKKRKEKKRKEGTNIMPIISQFVILKKRNTNYVMPTQGNMKRIKKKGRSVPLNYRRLFPPPGWTRQKL